MPLSEPKQIPPPRGPAELRGLSAEAGRAPWPLAGLTLLLLAGCTAEPALDRRGRSLLITLIDAASALHLSAYGYPRSTTPFLERFAERGLRFADVSAAAPYTLASVASLFLGEHVDVHGVEWAGDPLPEGLEVLPEAFEEAGYRCFGFSSNLHISPRFGFERGFSRFEFVDPEVGRQPHHEVPPALLAGLSEELRREPGRALFGYVHLMPPHAPYDPPPPFATRFGAVDRAFGSIEFLTPLSRGARVATPAERQAVIDLYDASLAYADSILEGIGADLERSGRAGEVDWIVISDHGEAFGERKLFQHSSLVLETMLRVPLLWRFCDGSLAGQVIERPVSLIDLHPTLRELYGLPGLAPETSISLVPLLLGRPLEREPWILARTASPGPYTSLRRGPWKLTFEAQTKRRRLHQVERDVFELDNRLQHEQPRAAALEAELTRWWARHRPAAAARSRLPLDAATRAQLERIGYLPGEAPLDPAPSDPQAPAQPAPPTPPAESGGR
jgi:arylsulfatase A-like enzyme